MQMNSTNESQISWLANKLKFKKLTIHCLQEIHQAGKQPQSKNQSTEGIRQGNKLKARRYGRFHI